MKLLKNKTLKTQIIPRVGYFLLKGLELSCFNVKYINEEVVQDLVRQKKPIIYATWHGSMYGLARIHLKEKIHLLISNSNDGEMVNNIAKMFGFQTIRGSLNREGAEAFREIVSVLRQGDHIVITVDGPRGPLYDVKEGVIRIAKLSGASIVPYIPAARYQIVIKKAWDHFKIPIPFTPVICYFGEPLTIDSQAGKEDVKRYINQLKESMLTITEKVDKMIR